MTAKLFTRAEANGCGISDRQLDWAVRTGRYVRLQRGVYFEGDRSPLLFEYELAKVVTAKKIVGGKLAAALHGFDAFQAPRDGCYDNLAKASVFETLLGLAVKTNDSVWEQALEWILRKRQTTIDEIQVALETQRYGNARIQRVLKLRPDGVPPTGSILETHMVQLVRLDSALPMPSRQVEVLRAYGKHPAYVDLAWPECGVFVELDGEQHKDQPRYDATRQTAVVAAMGWLVGRYTWTDVVHHPKSTLRSVAELLRVR